MKTPNSTLPEINYEDIANRNLSDFVFARDHGNGVWQVQVDENTFVMVSLRDKKVLSVSHTGTISGARTIILDDKFTAKLVELGLPTDPEELSRQEFARVLALIRGYADGILDKKLCEITIEDIKAGN